VSAPPTDSVNEHFNESFTAVVSKSRRKLLKRKDRLTSPSTVDGASEEMQPNKRINDGRGGQPSYVGGVTNTTNVHLKHSAYANAGKIMGKSGSGKLKVAAPTITQKAVFCISNVGSEYLIKDIRDNCLGMGVNVLFCYDISSESVTLDHQTHSN